MVGRRRRVPDWVYYVVASLLSMLTIPMYRYMFQHAGHQQDVVSAMFVSSSPSAVSGLPVAAVVDRKPLLDGELCEGGYVILRNGSSYTQLMAPDGRPARCAGRFLIQSP